MSVSPSPVGRECLGDPDAWPVVELDGTRWYVAPELATKLMDAKAAAEKQPTLPGVES